MIASQIARNDRQPADEETRRAWDIETRRQVREEFGEEGEKRLETVREFIDWRPELAEHLSRTGAGSHPDVVMPLVRAALKMRVDPR